MHKVSVRRKETFDFLAHGMAERGTDLGQFVGLQRRVTRSGLGRALTSPAQAQALRA